MSDPFDDLVEITGVRRHAEMNRMQALSARENRLRALLAELEGQAGRADRLEENARMAQRTIGADLAWQSWIAAQRHTIQGQLATVMTCKDEARGKLRLAFGKAEVAAGLAEQNARDRKARRDAQRQIEQQSWLIAPGHRPRH